MKTNTAFAIFMFGLLITLGSVGGMENQPGYLLEQIALAIVGLCLMFVGTSAMNVSDYYDKTIDNPTLR